MSALSSALRKQLETSVLAARRAAESASRAGVESLGVFADRRPDHLDDNQAALRNGLRAKWRQLGGEEELLVAECAYEQWHRLLFARFLAENRLLRHPQYKAPVTLADCEELAAELGEPDGWSVAARFAAQILPGIFRLDDPCVQLRLAPEGRHALEQILDEIPAETFAAEDALGWVYQFWQKDKKDEVNASERKIGGADLGPITQLFTENYMVRFLLENSLGAWWAARHPDSPLIKGFDYLRFDEDGRPAVGSFDGWPDRVAEVTVMDPCCGSGHFLVAAFSMLWQMRAEEEGLLSVEAQDAVIRDNLVGLELDGRCAQIAKFAIALQAWKSGMGWRRLPAPRIACSGAVVQASAEDWQELAGRDSALEAALNRLLGALENTETLGSLIDPGKAAELPNERPGQSTFDDVDWKKLGPSLRRAAAKMGRDPTLAVLGEDVAEVAMAIEYLSEKYTLVITNVPYLGRRHQNEILRKYCETHYPRSRTDLSTVFLERLIDLTADHGTVGCVLPQNWLTLVSYRALREQLLRFTQIQAIALLGPGAFGAIGGEVVNTGLFVLSRGAPHTFVGVSVEDVQPLASKTQALKEAASVTVSQAAQADHPDSRILLTSVARGPTLEEYARIYKGLTTGDDLRFRRKFWELAAVGSDWVRLQRSADKGGSRGGCDSVIWWSEMTDPIRPGVELRGEAVWGSSGVAISQSSSLAANLYMGAKFDQTVAVLVAHAADNLPAIAAYCQSPTYVEEVRKLDKKPIVTAATLGKVPFDLSLWRRVAEETFGGGGKCFTAENFDNPTQWLFDGRPESSNTPLHVAVARLLGYRWPEQADSDDLDAFADPDGIVCLPAVATEASAADRLQAVLATAFGGTWSPARVKELLEQAGSKKKTLADWLRDEFFKQHCALFGNRPFVWHISDGRSDGFSALMNYHRLDRRTLEKLTYTYLGQDWVERQRAEVSDEVAGAEDRLEAAQKLQGKLEAILEGEEPYDVYVRWKEINQQPVGWDPDLNDGVRLNVRPFVEAGVLRTRFNVKWSKDRGKNPDGSERHNDLHLTLAEKRETSGVVGA